MPLNRNVSSSERCCSRCVAIASAAPRDVVMGWVSVMQLSPCLLVGRQSGRVVGKITAAVQRAHERTVQLPFQRSAREVRADPCKGSLHVGPPPPVPRPEPAAFAVRGGLARIRVEAALRPVAGRLLVARPARVGVAFSDLVHRHPVSGSADRLVPAGVPLSALRSALHGIRAVGVVGGSPSRPLPTLRAPPRSTRRSRRVLVAYFSPVNVSVPVPVRVAVRGHARARSIPRMVYGSLHG